VGAVPDEVWISAEHEVQVRRGAAECSEADSGFPAMIWLSIKRRDKAPIDTDHWRVLQRIKNEIVGPEHEAVEVYPAGAQPPRREAAPLGPGVPPCRPVRRPPGRHDA
jgi:hypothetical protein